MLDVLQQNIQKYKNHPFAKYTLIIALIIITYLEVIKFMFGSIQNQQIMLILMLIFQMLVLKLMGF